MTNHHDSHNHGHANGKGTGSDHAGGHQHHILSTKTAVTVGGALLLLTAVTVWSAGIDLGSWNVPIAMAIATTKALLVCLFFMNLWHDSKENSVVFFTSFLFLLIFVVLTGSDIFFRGNIYRNGPYAANLPDYSAAAGNQPAKFKKPWVETPELVSHGKTIFSQTCTTCHGAGGKGDGIASAGLNPAPRNFTADAGWKNGRKPSQIFKTLKEGIKGGAMAAYDSLPAEDRWALAHYVRSLGPAGAAGDTSEDLAKVGVDPTKEASTEAVVQTISIDQAIDRMAERSVSPEGRGSNLVRVGLAQASDSASEGERLYGAHCLQCHGAQGQGAVIRPMGYAAGGYGSKQKLETLKFSSYSSLGSPAQFAKLVSSGLAGNIMPGNGHLSGVQIQELYQYVKGLPGGR